MLKLTRKLGEKLRIGDQVVITVTRIAGESSVQLGIDAPRDVGIVRGELLDDDSREEDSPTDG